MKVRKFQASLRHLVAAVVVFTGLSSFGAPAGAESGNGDSHLSQLIDSASYSQADREALKSGLSVALPGAATDFVSQKTIDIQVKNSKADFDTALTLAVKLADHLEARTHEFINSSAFKRVDAANRKTVASYLNDVVEQYRARTFEALLSRYDRPVSVPASVPRSVENADYRALLDVAVKAALLPHQKSAIAPAVVEKAVEPAKPAVVAAAPAVIAAEPAVVENSTIVEKPVVAEKAVEAEKPVIVEKTEEKPVVAEKAVVIEKPVVADKPAVPGKRYTVAVGDSLALIARLNKIPPSAIVEANPGLQPMHMRVGQVIVIPTAEWVNSQKAASQAKGAPLLSSK